MLSRLAESFYWIGRYLERAEATARLLAEHYHLTVEDRSVNDDVAAAVVLDALSLPHDTVASPSLRVLPSIAAAFAVTVIVTASGLSFTARSAMTPSFGTAVTITGA